MQLKEKPELNQINPESEVLAKNYQPYRYGKKRESAIVILLKIIFIYFPLVAILLTILATISISFIGCGGSSKAKQSEGKQYVSSMNKSQQVYYVENSRFSNSFNDLGLGIKTQTTNYNYSTLATKNAAFSYAIPLKETKNLRSYVGAVSLVLAGEAMATQSILCQANSHGNTQLANPIIEKGGLVCAAGSSEVVK